MKNQTVEAYGLAARVASYDADMEIMHPNRSRMVEAALATIPFSPEDSFLALDLGVGTGCFTQKFLSCFPRCRVLAVDGSPAMLQLARARLGEQLGQVDFILGDFRSLSRLVGERRGKLVFSSYALHHLSRTEKADVVRQALFFLEPGGWFLNADLVVAESPLLEQRIQEIRVQGIVRRAPSGDPRFAGPVSTRRFLDELEREDQDQPLTLAEDLTVLKEAGLRESAVFWIEYREAVIGGVKTT